uniref:Uncharacterized protein n=1 Tax=Arabidopsis halleri TaxID=81970 RepID=K4FR36_ARAHA|nr:hypothetical protein 11M19.2 [Arabidopsis halleri]
MSELCTNPKKPKLKEDEEDEEANVSCREEQEEVLVALVEHRSNEIERLNHHISNYQNKLVEAERSLQNSKAKLAQLRGVSVPCISAKKDNKPLKTLRNVNVSEDYASPSPSKTLRPCDSSDHPRSSCGSSVSKAKTVVVKQKSETSRDSPNVKDRGMKRKFEQKEHKELIRLIARNSSPTTVKCHTSNQISSQHKRKLRSLILCPVNEQLFATRYFSFVWVKVTFLENKPHVKGIINNIKFMPWESTCFVTGGSDHAVVLWNESDDEENKWKSKTLHRNLHSAAVMGVDGMRNKNVVLSVGADKRIYGFDVQVGRADYKHQIDYKCMSILANPCDFNLFMVQSGGFTKEASRHCNVREPEKQLRLFDIRLRKTELHSFGWKQDSSESQSALINQSWSPDGLYITSGSVDPVIHVFDIRYNARKPTQSIKAHQKRVFKAEWHYSQPLLISISSDLNIGLHKIS